MNAASAMLRLALAATLCTSAAFAQSTEKTPGDAKPASHLAPQELRPSDPRPLQVLYLTNAAQVNEANEILTGLRLMLDPDVKLYLATEQNAILIRGSAEQIALAQRLIGDLDRPKHSYRLRYTLTESDGGKVLGVQHFAMVVTAGQRSTLKQGSKVPIVTGSFDQGKNGSQTQVTYLDIGVNLDVTAEEIAGGLRIKSLTEQSSMAEERSGIGAADPIVRQAKLEGTVQVVLGKPLVLGSLDTPGSTRHVDVEVVAEPVR